MPPTSAPSPCGARRTPPLGQEVGGKCEVEHETVVRKDPSGWSPYGYRYRYWVWFRDAEGTCCGSVILLRVSPRSCCKGVAGKTTGFFTRGSISQRVTVTQHQKCLLHPFIHASSATLCEKDQLGCLGNQLFRCNITPSVGIATLFDMRPPPLSRQMLSYHSHRENFWAFARPRINLAWFSWF